MRQGNPLDWVGTLLTMSEAPEQGTVTNLLQAWRNGQPEALTEVVDILYAELRRIAGAHLRRERAHHTFEPSELVHEAFVRLRDQGKVDWQNRSHFLAISSTVMRRVLGDYARAKGRKKRKGIHVTLSEVGASSPAMNVDVIALDRALERLEEAGHDLELKVVQLRYFGGLTIEEVAEHLSIGTATVSRAWTFARTWLYRELKR